MLKILNGGLEQCGKVQSLNRIGVEGLTIIIYHYCVSLQLNASFWGQPKTTFSVPIVPSMALLLVV